MQRLIRTGTVNATEYWFVKLIDGEVKISGKYTYFKDAIEELTVYKEFEKDEK